MKLLKSLFILAALTLAAACDGPVGPKGEPGEPGTANIVYSDWTDIDWNQQDDSDLKIMGIELDLSDAFFESGGSIYMFVKGEESTTLVVLPLPLVAANASLRFSYTRAPGEFVGLRLINESLDGETPVPDFEGFQVRYVLIPGGVPAEV